MPLSDADGAVSAFAEALTHSGMRLRNLLARTIEMEQRLAGINHRTAWHTHSARCSARTVRAGKRGAFRDKAIEIRRFDLVISKRMNRIEALIISQQKQDIRFVVHYNLSFSISFKEPGSSTKKLSFLRIACVPASKAAFASIK